MDFSLHPGALGVHDYGGQEDDGDDETTPFHPAAAPDRPFALWESQVHAVAGLLVGKGLITLDELRRGIESLPKEQYSGGLSYYEKWASSLLAISLERGTVSQEEVDAHLGPPVESCEEPVYKVGMRVQVRAENIATRWRRPHLRTPGYIHGAVGVIERVVGVFESPELNAYRHVEGVQPLYRVRFAMPEVWAEYTGPAQDTIDVEIYQSWLQEPAEGATAGGATTAAAARKPPQLVGGGRVTASVQSDAVRTALEQAAVDEEGAEGVPPHVAALVGVLLEKGILTADEMREAVEGIESWGADAQGPRIVAHAWADAGFHARLLKDASAACLEIGIETSNSTSNTKLLVVVRTRQVASSGMSFHTGGAACRRIPRHCTTWLCVPCAPASRCRCWVARRTGTSRVATARAPCASLARFSQSSAWRSLKRPRCACTTARPTAGTWSSRSGQRGRRAGTRRRCRHWSGGTRSSGRPSPDSRSAARGRRRCSSLPSGSPKTRPQM